MTARRRALVALGLNALVFATGWPIARAASPSGKVLRLGLLYALRGKFDPDADPIDRALIEGLRANGYEVGRNVTLEFRSAAGAPERLRDLAAELVRLKVDILIPLGSGPTQAAVAATKTIPIVTIGTRDPVATGFVASLSRPGGNLTGLAVNATDMAAKRVQLLKEAVPTLSSVAVLWNSNYKVMELEFQQVAIAAPALGVSILSLKVQSGANFEQAFAAIQKARPHGLIVLFGPMKGDDLPRIVEFVTRNRLPTIFEFGRR
jgi:putative ABC transport system substrate-binding protein